MNKTTYIPQNLKCIFVEMNKQMLATISGIYFTWLIILVLMKLLGEQMKDVKVQMIFIMIGVVFGVIITWFVMREELSVKN